MQNIKDKKCLSKGKRHILTREERALYIAVTPALVLINNYDINLWFFLVVLTGSPSRGGDVVVNRACPLLSILFLCLFLSYGPFNCISFHKFSQQLSAFSLYSSRLISALLVLSTIYHHHHQHHQSLNREGRWGTADDCATICLFMKVSFSSDIIPCGWLGLKH